MALEHYHDAASGGQLHGRLVAGSASSFLPTSRANSPGCGVKTRGPPGCANAAALAGQGIQGIGIEHHRLGDLSIKPNDKLLERRRPAQTGPARNHRGRFSHLDNAIERACRNMAGRINRQGKRHIRRLEAGDRVENRLGHSQPHQSGAAPQCRHAGQRGRSRHAPRSAHNQCQSEIALMCVGKPRGQTRQFVLKKNP